MVDADNLYLFPVYMYISRLPTHESQSPPTAPRPPGTLDEDYEVC